MAKFDVKVEGVDKLLRKLDRISGAKAVADIDRITEAYARKMAAESARMAPVKTGALKNSIAKSPRPSDEPHAWEWGSHLPYATRQEYEHRTHKAFARRAIWNNEKKYRDAVMRRLTKG